MVAVPTIGAIPTKYRGIKFRSRLEARWAVFFDTLGVLWEYEPEGYRDGSMYYLPDFWLSREGVFWEVKPRPDFDRQKPIMLSKLTGHDVLVAFGPVGPTPPQRGIVGGCETCETGEKNSAIHFRGDIVDLGRCFVECSIHGPFLDLVDYRIQVFRNVGWRRCCGNAPAENERVICTNVLSSHGPRLHEAYTAARSYQFWTPPSATATLKSSVDTPPPSVPLPVNPIVDSIAPQVTTLRDRVRGRQVNQ